jgi:hypothetical protein
MNDGRHHHQGGVGIFCRTGMYVQQLVHNKTQRCQEKTWINHTMFRCVCDQVDDKQYILVEKKNPCVVIPTGVVFIFYFFGVVSHITKKKNDDGAHPLSLFESIQTHTQSK